LVVHLTAGSPFKTAKIVTLKMSENSINFIKSIQFNVRTFASYGDSVFTDDLHLRVEMA